MYKICKTSQSIKRQKEIEDVLFNIMKKKNYECITVTEICAEMNMPRKAFYRYFDSKEDVLHALIDHIMITYKGFSNKEKGNMKKDMETFFLFWYENRELLDVLEKNNLIMKIFECAANFPINDMISMSKYLPEESEWAKSKIFNFAIFGLLFEAINWHKEGFKTNISDMSDIAFRILTQPLFPNLRQSL